MSDTRRIKLTIEYDGTDFVGWQHQENGRAVQTVIETAATQLLQEEVRITGAGRTDAGVHARGQVAHFDTCSDFPTEKIVRGLNALLPDDITIRDAVNAEPNFHARFSASSRRYRYSLTQERISLGRQYRWHLFRRIESLDQIQRVVAALCGTHDFNAFAKKSEDVDHTFCHVFETAWSTAGSDHDFHIRANRFLYGMVRTLIGALVKIGCGELQSDDFMEALQSGKRQWNIALAPPCGLVFEEVRYDPDEYEQVRTIMNEITSKEKRER